MAMRSVISGAILSPPGLQQRLHLVPSIEHAPAIDTLDDRAFENDLVGQIQFHRLGGDSQQGNPPAPGPGSAFTMACMVAAGMVVKKSGAPSKGWAVEKSFPKAL